MDDGGGGIHRATFKSRQTWGRGVICLVQMRMEMGSLATSSGSLALLCSLSCDLKLVRSLEL